MSCYGKSNKKAKKVKNELEDQSASVPLIGSDVSIYSENENSYKNEAKTIFKDIEEEKTNDNEIIKKLNHMIDINGPGMRKNLSDSKTGYDNFSLLHYAAKTCRSDLCQYLIEEIGIDSDVRSKSRMTPLHILVKSNAFAKEDTSSMKLLCTRPANINDQKLKFESTFELLIEKNSDCNAIDESGFSTLHHAVHRNNYEAVALLLDLDDIQVDSEDNNRMTPLHIACKYGYEDIGNLLIEKTNARTLSSPLNETLPLHFACRNKKENPELVKKMLEKIKQESASDLYNILKRVDNNRHTILQIAIDNNQLNTVDLLLKEYFTDGADHLEDRNGSFPIHYAAKTCGAEMLKVLIKNNCFTSKTNGNLDNALHIAASNNRFKFIKEFLSHEKQIIEISDPKDYVPSVKALNRAGYTPMFVALINGHLKCVEALLASDNLDSDAKDFKGNSIYHICAEYNNFESMRILLKKDQKYADPLFIKNENEENVVHTACSNGNIEIIKLVISKINDGFSSMETYLVSKNKEGKTCFHIACIKGYFNIIEYFLKDLNLVYFLDQLDNEANTALHLASSNGHLSIVFILLEYGADLNAKNKEGATALELSCRKGFFEISKILISRYSIMQSNQSEKSDEYPLHIACYEGAYELVELLLSKGAPIEVRNSKNQNCLDIAISRDHREVVKVLLTDKNWDKLIDVYTGDRNDHKINVVNVAFRRQISRFSSSAKKENPQIVAMYENKMWESLKILLDNCKMDEDYDFKKLDPPSKNIQKHPLMIMARSGQETLLKHETTKQLLKLKWRFIPRFAFYSNIFFYLLYLVLFSIYTNELSHFAKNNDDSLSPNPSNSTLSNDTDTIDTTYSGQIFESNLSVYIMVILVLSLIKKCLQIILVDGLSFFASGQNWAEVTTFIFSLIALLTTDLETKVNICSVTVLSSFIVFSFLIQKLRVFGLYVLAFRRTLENSAKFFPIFFLIFIGFNLSFNLRSNLGVNHFNTTTGLALVRTLSMVLGDLNNDDMGLDVEMELSLFLNYLIYFSFIGLMCTITFNLFVGIAVGEIKTVLDEADIQQISMRIVFVLKVQESLNRFNNMCCLKWLNIRFEEYSYDKEYKFIKTKDKVMKFFRKRFASIEPEIKLVDPQKRLEDNLSELARTTNADLKSIREMLTNQIADVETKLSNSQQRLEDCLVEMSRKTTNNFENTQEDSTAQMTLVGKKVEKSQDAVTLTINVLNENTNEKMESLKEVTADQLSNTKIELLNSQKQIGTNLMGLSDVTNCLNDLAGENFSSISSNFGGLMDKMEDLQQGLQQLATNMSSMKSSQDNLIDLNKKFGSLLDNFLIENDVKQALDTLVDELIDDSKETEQEEQDLDIGDNKEAVDTEDSDKNEQN